MVNGGTGSSNGNWAWLDDDDDDDDRKRPPSQLNVANHAHTYTPSPPRLAAAELALTRSSTASSGTMSHTPGPASSPTSSAVRSFEVEKAVHMLKMRLSLASAKAHVPHTWAVDAKAASTSPPSHQSLGHAESSTSPQSTFSATSIESSDEHGELCNGTKSAAPSQAPFAGTQTARAPAQGQTLPPSIYDVVFGSAGLRSTPSTPQLAEFSGRSRNNSFSVVGDQQMSEPGQRRSPHVRQGTSAQLELLASSPQPGSPEDLSGRKDEHNQPTRAQLERERQIVEGRNKTWKAVSPPPPQQQQQQPNGRPLDKPFSFQSQPASPFQKARDGSNSPARQRGTPSHRRIRSMGGSVLPNGHPASMLAQDLGIASGSCRTPRSRQAATFANASHNASPRHGQSTFADPNLLTPRRKVRAGMANGNGNGTQSQRSSPEDENGEESSEAAAHSLLDLAASPSPSPLNKSFDSRFMGQLPSFNGDAFLSRRRSHIDMTQQDGESNDFAPRPSKKRIVDDLDRNGHSQHFVVSNSRQSDIGARPMGAPLTPTPKRGHLRTGSLGSLRALQTSPSKLFAASTNGDVFKTPEQHRNFGEHRRQSSSHTGGRVRLMSPPMTPPQTEHGKSSKQGRSGLDDIPSSPKTPTRSSDLKGDGELIAGQGHSIAPRSPKMSTTNGVEEKVPLATPHTPPQGSTTPNTPKAPGSNFSYGDFLHVSPSPQPRQRTFSHHGSGLHSANGSLQHAHEKGMVMSFAETPTRGTRSNGSRFLDFSNDVHASPDGGMERFKQTSYLDDASAAANATPKGLGVSGLGSAFEQQGPLDVEAGDDAFVLVPGKRVPYGARSASRNANASDFGAPLTPTQRQPSFRP